MAHHDLWAPWRMAYLRDLEARHGDVKSADAPQLGNFLRAAWEDPANDHAHFVVHRNEHGLIMLNRYPYSNGHVLVALAEARPTLQDYTAPQRAHLWELVDFAVELVERALHAQGVNVGVNQGRAAGAGLPEHLHVHVVPRWSGDTNFMATIGEVRVVPDSLECSWQALRAAVRR
ncbi:MAG: HIT domain-containing protein [Phycisphaerae bacterium]|nr:HIT domain-containing protein [Phycisphaerae bacterium]